MAEGAARFGHDPIERSEDDRLGRKDFAGLLAGALAGSPGRRSVVVALYGDWGSGKTSTLNLCFAALEALLPEERPLVVRFNPWWYSNTGELLAQFFDELGGALEEQAGRRGVGGLEGIKEKLVSYRRLIAPAGAVADLFVSGGALTLFAKLAEAGVESAAREQGGAQTVHELRGDIEGALREAGRPVVIAIDDIDRLSASEIRDVFKLVKATADFPNTRYLLAFDFGTVAAALSEVQHTDGAAYLEKIVQVPFRLPDPAPGQLMDIVKEGVEEIASGLQAVPQEDVEHAMERLGFRALFGLGSLFDNMRRANRFLDSLRLTLPTVAGEVRLSDFVLLEALRVTEPRAYELVLDGQNLLVGPTPGADAMLFMGARSGDPQEEANRATAALVEAVCDAPERKELRGVIREVLEELFPRAEAARRGSGGYGRHFLDEWANYRRVCVPEFFRAATRWGLPSGTISSSEVRNLVSITDPNDLRDRLRVYDEDARDGVDYSSALERVGPFYRTEADPAALEAIVRVVLGENRTRSRDDRAHELLVSLAQDALERLPDPDTRKRILLDAIGAHSVLPVTADLLRDLGLEHGWHGRDPFPDEHRTLPTAQFREVLSAALDDVRSQAAASELTRRPLFDEYLYLWRDAAGDEEPGEYLREMIGDQRGFATLLSALAGEEGARLLAAGEPLPDASSLASPLRPLWVFGLQDEARTRADEVREHGAPDEERGLLDWFVAAHESANRPIDAE